ncbi:hypothetical protein LAZ67_12002981, partial [Cordylochernes scorpioides]
MLQKAYGDAVMSRRRVLEWYKRFKEGREETADNERSGRPSTSTTPEKVNKVLELVREDRRITVREVAEEAGISLGSTQSILKDILGVRRLNAVLVPKDLTFDQKNARKETASLNLEAKTDDPELLKRVITGDETWIYGFDSETTQQASEWRFKNEPRPKKARKAPSKVKVILTVFFDYQGIVHHEFQQQGSTITADSYLGVLRRLREAIREKRPELWRSKSWILHHDNAPAHTALKISKFLQDLPAFLETTETFEMLNKAFPNDAPKRTTVFEWHSRFKAGRISIEDDPRQRRPKFQRTDENVQKITDLIKENPRTTLLELEQDTGISKTTIGRIVTEDLKLKKTPAKFIPRFLTNEQKLCRLATCEDMMEMTRTDPEWKDKIITGDETWVYGYDPETKPQSAEWRAYGDAVMSRRRVLEWYKRFKEGREETADNERSGRPSTSTTSEKVNKVLELVREDRRITVREVAEEAGISFGSTQSIMKDILGVRRLNAVHVPKDLTFDQKNARKETASLNLEATTDDPELLKRVITGDETWIYGFDSETTQQASEWRFKNEPRPKKARKAPSKVK